MKIIMINGKKGSGKDTLADLIMCYLIKHGVKVGKIPNAEYVKTIATTMYGWDGNKDAKGRKLLIDITNAGYNYENHFFERITYYKALNNKLDVLIIPDWRYQSTYRYLRDKETGNVHTIRVSRKETTKDNPLLDNDISETGLDKFPFDLYILNNGSIDELDRKIEPLLRQLNIVSMY